MPQLIKGIKRQHIQSSLKTFIKQGIQYIFQMPYALTNLPEPDKCLPTLFPSFLQSVKQCMASGTLYALLSWVLSREYQLSIFKSGNK